MPVPVITERRLSAWLAQAKGRRLEHNYVKTADCTDVSNDVLYWCFPSRFRTAADRVQGHGKDVARNMAAKCRDLYRLETFNPAKQYPLGTVFSCRPPAWEEVAASLTGRTIYGHTGVLLGQGVGHRQPVAQQDTYRDVACWVAPSVSRYPISEVAVPLFTDPAPVQTQVERPMLHRLVRTKAGVPPHAIAWRADGTPYDHHVLPHNFPVYPTGAKRGGYVQVKVARFGNGEQTSYRLGSTAYVHPIHLIKTQTPY